MSLSARTLFAAVALALALWAPAPGLAQARHHKVRAGQTLASLAKRYGVSAWSLAAANRMDPQAKLRAGQVLTIPDRGVVYVSEGQTLWSIARKHHTTVDALAKANRIKPTSSLTPGLRLVLPGHRPTKRGRGARAWGRPERPGRVTFVRVATKERLRVTLVSRNGRVRKAAVNQLARLLRPRKSKRWRRPPRRLLALLARVSDHFGGRPLYVVSGYRKVGGYTGPESRHVDGAAIDFRVKGVPNRVLRDYLRQFDRVGVGYYPNSTFVHLDVRDKRAYWVDVSRPGAKPRYVAPSEFREQRAAHALAQRAPDREARASQDERARAAGAAAAAAIFPAERRSN